MSSDPYDKSSIYWTLWGFIVLYVLVVGIPYLGIFVQSTAPLTTWFASPGAPGSHYVSFAGTFLDVTNRMNIIGQTLVTGVVGMLVWVRGQYGWSIFWFTLYALSATLNLLSVIALGDARSRANGPGQFGNPFNDPAYCCAYPGNGCPTSIPCTDPVILPEQLGYNTNAEGLLWTAFVLLLLQVAFMVAWGVIFGFRKGEEKEKEDEEPTMTVVPPKEDIGAILMPAPVPSEQTVRNRLHGLRAK